MFRQLYEWIQNIAVYLIVVSAVMHAIPEKGYEKYIRFFSGLVLILLLTAPLLNLTGMAEEFARLYAGREYDMDRREIERAEEMLQDADLLEFVPEEAAEWTEPEEPGGDGTESAEKEEKEESGDRIEVGEIRIGEDEDQELD